jgi:hypothetical protein
MEHNKEDVKWKAFIKDAYHQVYGFDVQPTEEELSTFESAVNWAFAYDAAENARLKEDNERLKEDNEVLRNLKEGLRLDRNNYMHACDDLQSRIKELEQQLEQSNVPRWVKAEGAVELIAKERQRQIESEGWNSSHDANHKDGELIGAAACYVVNALNKTHGKGFARVQVYGLPETDFFVNSGDRGDRRLAKGGWRDAWPWSKEWDKREKHDKERSLVIAAALIIAELERELPDKRQSPDK